MDTLDKEMIHAAVDREQENARLHHAPQNGAQFKISELFISKIFCLIFLGHGWLWVTENTESKPVDKMETTV